jgi:hypothetical protein
MSTIKIGSFLQVGSKLFYAMRRDDIPIIVEHLTSSNILFTLACSGKSAAVVALVKELPEAYQKKILATPNAERGLIVYGQMEEVKKIKSGWYQAGTEQERT